MTPKYVLHDFVLIGSVCTRELDSQLCKISCKCALSTRRIALPQIGLAPVVLSALCWVCPDVAALLVSTSYVARVLQ